MTEHVNLSVIGKVDSPYKEKFAIPRQPGLVTAAKGQLRLTGSANHADAVRGLAQFSHLWLLFIFHGTQAQGWQPLVRPPRLGGNKKLGVFATRSTFRPSPIGMSVVKLDDIELRPCADQHSQVILHISELDLLDGTPVVDIKPYVPYADMITTAKAGFAQKPPLQTLNVLYSHKAQLTLTRMQADYPQLQTLITEVLSQDPRPAYKQQKLDDKRYGMRLYDVNISFQLTDMATVTVLAIEQENRQ
ncbi:tRNA-Thr(GGU) m(6)t(6)A37 methyltransferase TsaA [Colwellia chukchiensis]|uniref:tRNA-Thr(GGU) m(6)t(6)A37 methyltransferase TsaA n=1 Tax=Colwellia chukchiensis TaxID=641665 RepID=A0A1H7QD11_9GAMM|nr:tRNA (N6-threonylcarbamoyladenosine(37)-N6)-methyltransferase TrmO [Colwellia chukchiensis]SEL45766.1 tRNA-Thr(GGU) m(6)t(6)A37 methyltransferase TsaA [Colwellia chukchiensis]